MADFTVKRIRIIVEAVEMDFLQKIAPYFE